MVCHLIGCSLAVPLDAELILPGEDEIAAAQRLLERVCVNYHRFFDVVVGDALYNRASFINLCLGRRVHFIAVLKDNNKSLVEDLQGVMKLLEPKRWEDARVTVAGWDIEGFHHTGVNEPVRVLHTHETERARERVGGQWREKTETHTWSWVTDLLRRQLPTRLLWHASHRRWDIENDAFGYLSSYFALDHCFTHHPVAIINFMLTLFIAYILLQCFYQRNLKPQLVTRLNLTLIALSAKLYQGLVDPQLRAPWFWQVSGRPPPR